MKKTIVFAILAFATSSLFAQTKIGMVTYTVPAGWQVTQVQKGVILENKQTKGKICRIILSETENTVINNAALYVEQRQNKSVPGFSYNKNMKSVIQKDAGGLTCFYSASSNTNETSAKNFFYSFTNGQQSFIIQLNTNDTNCITAFQSFLATLLVDNADEAGSGASKAKRAKKAAPAAPAAPAPMM